MFSRDIARPLFLKDIRNSGILIKLGISGGLQNLLQFTLNLAGISNFVNSPFVGCSSDREVLVLDPSAPLDVQDRA